MPGHFLSILRYAFLAPALILSAGCATQPATPATASNQAEWYLYVGDDDESIEKRIAVYFKDTYEVEAQYHFADENDLILQYAFTSPEQNFPEISAYIDTRPSATEERNGVEVVTERLVTLTAYFILPDSAKTPRTRAIILEAINEWHIGRWVPQRIYLDVDGDIVLESMLNIPGNDFPVHAEIIGDQTLRMYNAWAEFYPSLEALLSGASAQPVGAQQIVQRYEMP